MSKNRLNNETSNFEISTFFSFSLTMPILSPPTYIVGGGLPKIKGTDTLNINSPTSLCHLIVTGLFVSVEKLTLFLGKRRAYDMTRKVNASTYYTRQAKVEKQFPRCIKASRSSKAYLYMLSNPTRCI